MHSHRAVHFLSFEHVRVCAVRWSWDLEPEHDSFRNFVHSICSPARADAFFAFILIALSSCVALSLSLSLWAMCTVADLEFVFSRHTDNNNNNYMIPDRSHIRRLCMCVIWRYSRTIITNDWANNQLRFFAVNCVRSVFVLPAATLHLVRSHCGRNKSSMAGSWNTIIEHRPLRHVYRTAEVNVYRNISTRCCCDERASLGCSVKCLVELFLPHAYLMRRKFCS